MKIAITGATGLVGRACVSALRDDGHDIVRLLRRPATEHAPSCTDLVVGDLASGSVDFDRMPACDAFIHAAARTPGAKAEDANRQQGFFGDNVDGTRGALRLCAASGARLFVFLSSIKVNGERTIPGRSFRADDAPAPQDAYAKSKLAAEELIEEEARRMGIDFVLIRSPLVYGPGAGGNFRRLVQLARSGMPLPFAALSNRRAMISDRNLASLVLSVACRRQPFSGIILAADPEQLSTPALLRLLGSFSGRPVRLYRVPGAALRILCRLPGIGRLFSRLIEHLEVDPGANRPDLGWQPPHSTASELARAAAAIGQPPTGPLSRSRGAQCAERSQVIESTKN